MDLSKLTLIQEKKLATRGKRNHSIETFPSGMNVFRTKKTKFPKFTIFGF